MAAIRIAHHHYHWILLNFSSILFDFPHFFFFFAVVEKWFKKKKYTVVKSWKKKKKRNLLNCGTPGQSVPTTLTHRCWCHLTNYTAQQIVIKKKTGLYEQVGCFGSGQCSAVCISIFKTTVVSPLATNFQRVSSHHSARKQLETKGYGH